MDIDKAYSAVELLKYRQKYERWRYFKSIAKQREFFAAGTRFAERMIRAGNRCGKTEAAAYEVSRHLTKNYPSWWQGYRFTRPVNVWVGSVTGGQAVGAAQTKLFGLPGSPEAQGTGFIEKDAIVKISAGRSAPNAIDSAIVKHASGGNSSISFKTYEQGRENWQGAGIDILWDDEEPDAEVLSEGLARLDGKGLFIITFTPLKGITPVVNRFLYEPSPVRHITHITLADCEWYTAAQKERMVAQYPVHERQARINGVPMLGEGAVFSTPIEDLLEPPLAFAGIPPHWPLIWGIDFGIGHPFAAVLLAWDKDTDTVHILTGYREKNAIPLQHVAAMKSVAVNVPVAWPHDGAQREASSGQPLAEEYRKLGLNMLKEHATFPTGGYSFEAGIMELENRMLAGKLKVNRTMTMWQEEYSSYHREKGFVVKVRDDLMSATRIGVMMLRKARCVPLGPGIDRPLRQNRRAVINPWTGKSMEPVRDPRGAMYGGQRSYHD